MQVGELLDLLDDVLAAAAHGAGAAGAFMPTKVSATSPNSWRMVVRPDSSTIVA